jgi:hypothetical protein
MLTCIYVHTCTHMYTLQNSKDGVGGVTSPGPGTVWRRDALSGLQRNAAISTADSTGSGNNSGYAFDWSLQPETVGRKVLSHAASTTTAATTMIIAALSVQLLPMLLIVVLLLSVTMLHMCSL